MKKSKKAVKDPSGEVIKVQLDHRTIIYVKSKSALQSWLTRYPNAKVI
ncbi:MAG: hypothetical protein IT233_08575 [Bacteroidia bacterium]|nr:hypothetical protein [Bacteroidia bacterium]